MEGLVDRRVVGCHVGNMVVIMSGGYFVGFNVDGDDSVDCDYRGDLILCMYRYL